MTFIDGILMPGMLSGKLEVRDGRTYYINNGRERGYVVPTLGQLEFYVHILQLRRQEALQDYA